MNDHHVWTVAVVGVSGVEKNKGASGVGKSLLCNRFLRGKFEDFYTEHCSTLSQTDFCGSPVINSEHWLYWGERVLQSEQHGGPITIRVIEQTEFMDDETFEPLAGPSFEPYEKRCARLRLESRDKLMYIRQEQLGMESDFPQRLLPEGKTAVDSFIFVFDVSPVPRRSLARQAELALPILCQLVKTARPVVVAASKCDSAHEGGLRMVTKLIGSRRLKAASLPVIQISSTRNVNIEEVFISASKPKSRIKILPFSAAIRAREDRDKQCRYAYSSVVQSLLASDGWPLRLDWHRSLCEGGLSRHPAFIDFVDLFGRDAARTLYDRYLAEMREQYMASRLRAVLPSLPFIFSSLLQKDEVVSMEWSEAVQRLDSHALFDTFFLPLGSLERVCEEGVIGKREERIPAEVLLMAEAAHTFQQYRQQLQWEKRRERQEEDLERLLSTCPQVTPGRSLHDVRLFLAGQPAWESMPSTEAGRVYDCHQRQLLRRAEADFVECLLEHLELLVDVVVARGGRHSLGPFCLTPTEMSSIKNILQEDIRFRHLSGVTELREATIRKILSFLARPLASDCPARWRCCQLTAEEMLIDFLSKHRHAGGKEGRLLSLRVHGRQDLVSCLLHDIQMVSLQDPLICSTGLVHLNCFSDSDSSPSADYPCIHFFLMDSEKCVDATREILSSMEHNAILSSTPVFLVDCYSDSLLQQVYAMASSVGGMTLSLRISSTTHSDGLLFFSRSQLISLAECLSECDERSRRALRVSVSLHCGDSFTTTDLLSCLLPCSSPFRVLSHSSLDSSTLHLLLESLRVDLRVVPFHSWLATPPSLPVHAHVLVYCGRRPASWAAARTAVRRILEQGDSSVSGGNILLVAVAHHTHYFKHKETNVLLTEGSELAASVGAAFVCVDTEEEAGEELASFCRRVNGTRPQSLHSSLFAPHLKSSSRDESAHGGMSKHCEASSLHRPPTLSSPASGSSSQAPLATPEMLDIAAEYSYVQEGSGSDSEALNWDRVALSSGGSASNGSSIASRMKSQIPLSTRSATMHMIHTTISPVGASTVPPSLRHSISSESIQKNDEKKRFAFVRKVKSSFRKKTHTELVKLEGGGTQGGEEGRGGTQGGEEGRMEAKQSRSLPQSPFLQRKTRRDAPPKKNTLPLLGSVNGTQKVSSTFSWLSRRSPLSPSPPPSLQDGEDCVVHAFLTTAIALIEKEGGLTSEGIYRISGSRNAVEEASASISAGDDLSGTGVDVYSVAVAVKNRLARLRNPLLPRELQEDLLTASSAPLAERVSAFRMALHPLPPFNRQVLEVLCAHLDRVAASPHSAMNFSNLAIVWLPALLQPHFGDMDSLTSQLDSYKALLTFFLTHWKDILQSPNND